MKLKHKCRIELTIIIHNGPSAIIQAKIHVTVWFYMNLESFIIFMICVIKYWNSMGNRRLQSIERFYNVNTSVIFAIISSTRICEQYCKKRLIQSIKKTKNKQTNKQTNKKQTNKQNQKKIVVVEFAR